MKYVILHGDGMGDWPIESLGGKTPLEAARIPTLDRLASRGQLGLLHTIPEGLPPGSDVGSLTLFGFNPRGCYTGRSPIEAAAMGIDLGPADVAYRCNLVNLDLAQDPPVMVDFTSGHITTEEAGELIRAVEKALGGEGIEFHPGVSYRHCMVWRNGKEKLDTTPPHDITDQPIGAYWPKGEGDARLKDLMLRSRAVLADHPVNRRRMAEGKRPATQIWLWGQGTRPKVQGYREKFGFSGPVVSAVDLVKGLGVLCGLDVPDIEGATGWVDTNCENKVAAALAGLEKNDFAYVHLEAPDEAGHQGDIEKKIAAIEMFDARIVAPILKGLEKFGSFRVLISPDHPTPIKKKSHTSEPVPFIFFDSEQHKGPGTPRRYNEKDALAAGLVIREGYTCWNNIVKLGRPGLSETLLVEVFAFIFGSLFGSFLNVVIYRLPVRELRKEAEEQARLDAAEALAAQAIPAEPPVLGEAAVTVGEAPAPAESAAPLEPPAPVEVDPVAAVLAENRPDSIVFPGSLCPHCRAPIPWYLNIPMLSWLVLLGKCRACKAPISVRYPLVELAGGLVALAIVMQYGAGWWAGVQFAFAAALIAITFIDLDHMIIPDVITIPGMAVGLAAQVARDLTVSPSLTHLISADSHFVMGCLALLVGGGSFWLVAFLFARLRGFEGLGGGDVKLMAMVGAFTDPFSVLQTSLVGSFTGTVVGGLYLVLSRKGARQPIPFGPFLAFGALTAVLAPGALLRWLH